MENFDDTNEENLNSLGLCVMPWINMQVATDGKIAPCCLFDGDIGHVADTKLLDAWHGSKLQDIRKRFAGGEKIKECWRCHESEANEGHSMRVEKNTKFPKWLGHIKQATNVTTVTPKFPLSLDLRFSNLCNFKCRSCWHGASSKWFADAQALDMTAGKSAEIRSFSSVNEAMSQINECLESIEEIYFAGGEPLIQKEHYTLLRQLCDQRRTNVRLEYNTNLSVTKLNGVSIFEIWSKFDKVAVTASVDASGERGAYLRNGFSWDIFVENIRELKKQCPKVDLNFGITVSVLNVMILPDLLRNLRRECEANLGQLYLHSALSPNHYRTQVLPKAMKQKAVEGIEAYIDEIRKEHPSDQRGLQQLIKYLQGVVSFMYAADHSVQIQIMQGITQRLDTLRDEDMARTLPEIKILLIKPPWWQSCRLVFLRLAKALSSRFNRCISHFQTF